LERGDEGGEEGGEGVGIGFCFSFFVFVFFRGKKIAGPRYVAPLFLSIEYSREGRRGRKRGMVLYPCETRRISYKRTAVILRDLS